MSLCRLWAGRQGRGALPRDSWPAAAEFPAARRRQCRSRAVLCTTYPPAVPASVGPVARLTAPPLASCVQGGRTCAAHREDVLRLWRSGIRSDLLGAVIHTARAVQFGVLHVSW